MLEHEKAHGRPIDVALAVDVTLVEIIPNCGGLRAETGKRFQQIAQRLYFIPSDAQRDMRRAVPIYLRLFERPANASALAF
jgi:hypothetical protein